MSDSAVRQRAGICALAVVLAGGCGSGVPGEVVTVAGGAEPGFADGTGPEARFSLPLGIVAGADGAVYVSESCNHRIRRVSSSGEVTTVAGTGAGGSADGPALSATFFGPVGLAMDGEDAIIIADFGNHAIRRLDLATGIVETLAGLPTEPGLVDGPAAAARFWQPAHVYVEADGSIVVSDTFNNVIRRISADRSTVETIAGQPSGGFRDGEGTSALFTRPWGITSDGAGGLFVADGANDMIRHIAPDGTVSTVLGRRGGGYANGSPADARLDAPTGIAFDGTTLWIADRINAVVRAWEVGGSVRLAAGTPGAQEFRDGSADAAAFVAPADVAIDAEGTVYVVSQHAVRALRF